MKLIDKTETLVPHVGYVVPAKCAGGHEFTFISLPSKGSPPPPSPKATIRLMDEPAPPKPPGGTKTAHKASPPTMTIQRAREVVAEAQRATKTRPKKPPVRQELEIHRCRRCEVRKEVWLTFG